MDEVGMLIMPELLRAVVLFESLQLGLLPFGSP
jgi:hypothetical protein